jgi:hypothetical protein
MGIVTSGLVGYWHAQQGVNGSTWNNIAPNTTGLYNGTITGGATTQSGGMYFDGVDDVTTITNFDAINTLTDFSFQVLMSFISTGNNITPYSWFVDANNRYGFIIDPSSKPNYGYNTGGTFNSMTGTSALTPGQQYLLTVVHNASGRSFYVDNTLIKQDTVTMVGKTYKLGIGAYFADTGPAINYFKGYVINAKVYNKALTSAEISQNYTNGTAVGLTSGTAFTANLSDSFTLSETFNKTYTPGASGTAYTKSLSDSFALSETFTKVTSRYKTVTESITLSETITKRYSGFKTINDAITSAETFAKQFAGYKSLSDSVPSSDSVSRQFTARKTVNDSISFSDSLSKSFTATIIDSIATGDAENEQSSKLLNDILSSADSVSSTKGKAVNLSDSIAITETIRKALAKVQTDSISSTDVDSESINRLLNDVVASTDSITTFKGKTVTLSDSITLTDALNKAISSLKIDSVGLSENFGKTSAVSVRVYDVIISTDHLDTFLPNVPTYNEVIQLTLEIAQGKTVNLAIVERGNYELDVVERKTIDIKL